MDKHHLYTLDDIDNLRLITWLLNLSDEIHQHLSIYEKIDLTEKMLNTYMSQGIRYEDLRTKYDAKEFKLEKNEH
jgi:hypothetical protein